MRKFSHKTILLSCLAMFGLLFNSCSVTDGNDVNQNNMNLRTLSSGLSSRNYADAPTGCYEVIRWTSGDANILFNDLQSKQRVFLSSDLGSKHDNESDPSYIKSSSCGLSIMKSDKYLYVLGCGRQAKSSEELEFPSFLEQRELTGGMVNSIELPANMIFNEGGAFAAGNDKLYFATTVFTYNDNDISYRYWLYTYDEKTGILSPFYEFTTVTYAGIISAYDDVLVIKCVEKIDGKPNMCIYGLNISTSEFYKITDEGYTMTMNDKLYVVCDDKSIKEYSITEDTTTSLVSFGDEVTRVSLVAEPVDDNLFIYTYNENTYESKYYVFNTAYKSLKEIDLYNDEGHFIGIYGRRGDYYFVITGKKLVSFKNIAPDHMTVFDDERVDYEYAWIKKSDYCNSIPNFEPIESKIEYR